MSTWLQDTRFASLIGNGVTLLLSAAQQEY
jgi:hypothetical protein